MSMVNFLQFFIAHMLSVSLVWNAVATLMLSNIFHFIEFRLAKLVQAHMNYEKYIYFWSAVWFWDNRACGMNVTTSDLFDL